MKDAPGQDMLAQARSGMIATMGDYGSRPVPAGNALIDQHGSTIIAMGIAAAYAKQLQTGEGTRIEANLLNAALDLQTEPLTSYLSRPDLTSDVFKRDPHLATWYHPAPYGIYQMTDCFVAISMNNTAGPLADILKNETLKALSEKDLLEERDAFANELARSLKDLSLSDMAEKFDEKGIWYARVQDYSDLRTDPQVAANRVLREVPIGQSKATLINHPLRYDDKVPELRHLALRCGQDGRDILDDLGFTQDQIEEYVSNGVIYEEPEK